MPRIVFVVLMALDLLIPYLLAPLFRGYSHSRMAMSELGGPRSPVRAAYNCWLVAGGIAFVPCTFAFWRMCRPASPALAGAVLALQLVFAAGAMILSGLFSVGEGKAMTTLSARIHGFGSSLGFLALLATPLLLAVLMGRRGLAAHALICAVSFGLALLFFVLFVMADKPAFARTIVAREGAWQRLTLLFSYLPTAWLCLVYPA